jgi:hypothetical protein
MIYIFKIFNAVYNILLEYKTKNIVPVPVSGKVEIGKEYTHDVGKGPKTVN